MTDMEIRVREIVTDCVITGYENAGELIDKSTDAILQAVREHEDKQGFVRITLEENNLFQKWKAGI